MSASNTTAFDAIAADYDSSFSDGLIGKCQRTQVREWLGLFLKDKKELNILEINCGTGDDAMWLASLGHRVVATDASAAMIEQAKNKSAFSHSDQPFKFIQCAFDELPTLLTNEKFDLIFSNFSGLNCVPADELQSISRQLHDLLNPGGHIAVVIFGKYCWWETVYFFLSFRPGKAFRRWRKKTSFVELKEGSVQPVYYYSTRRFCQLFDHFKKVDQRPVGLFVPPSYLEPQMQKRRRLFNVLEKLEMKTDGMKAFSQFADHQYLLLKKE